MLDAEDKDIYEMLHGEEKPLHPNTIYRTAVMGVSEKETATPKVEKTAQKVTLKPRDAEWEPVPHEHTQMEKIKECAKSALLFGGLSLMFFGFQMSGQMTATAAMPCICACCILMGLGVGKNVR
jgi:hypothetical protein